MPCVVHSQTRTFACDQLAEDCGLDSLSVFAGFGPMSFCSRESSGPVVAVIDTGIDPERLDTSRILAGENSDAAKELPARSGRLVKAMQSGSWPSAS